MWADKGKFSSKKSIPGKRVILMRIDIKEILDFAFNDLESYSYGKDSQLQVDS